MSPDRMEEEQFARQLLRIAESVTVLPQKADARDGLTGVHVTVLAVKYVEASESAVT